MDCEKLVKCPFFEKFKEDEEVVKNGWIRMFCCSKDKSESCERKKYFKANGESPPPNMTPKGTFIRTKESMVQGLKKDKK